MSKQWAQSMSRIIDLLDNHVIEFWFSILKTELIYNLNIAQMTFNQLENEINNFIDYYNDVRIQKNKIECYLTNIKFKSNKKTWNLNFCLNFMFMFIICNWINNIL